MVTFLTMAGVLGSVCGGLIVMICLAIRQRSKADEAED